MIKNDSSYPSFWQVIRRGAACCCPNCGKSKLFISYLKQCEQCSHCHEPLGHIRADDGPAWLTIVIVGHIFAPFLFGFPNCPWPDWVRIGVIIVAALLLTFWLLPRAKGVFIGIIWRAKCSGSERNS